MLKLRKNSKEKDPSIVAVDYCEVTTARQDITFEPARDMVALGLAMVIQPYTRMLIDSEGHVSLFRTRGARLVTLSTPDTSDPRCNGGTD